MPLALVTGASRGLGLALTRALAARGWTLIVDARRGSALRDVLEGTSGVTIVPGDVSDPQHREQLAGHVRRRQGGLDLLVNNASSLGPSPLPGLDVYPLDHLDCVLDVNVVAPLALTQLVLPDLVRANGVIVNVTSDAAVEAYPGWGGYGASKAALDQISAVLAKEYPELHVYAFDPGDMRTQMHQDAFPGEDISDRPEPETVVPALLHLVDSKPPSARYRASDLLATSGAAR